MIDMKANRAILVASLVGGLFFSPALAHAAATYEFEATNPTGDNENFAKGVFEFDQDDKFSNYSIRTQFGLNMGGTLFGVEFEFTPQNSSVIGSDNDIDRAIDILAPFPKHTSNIKSNRNSQFLLAENITAQNLSGTEMDLGYWALTLAFEEMIGSSQGEVGLNRATILRKAVQWRLVLAPPCLRRVRAKFRQTLRPGLDLRVLWLRVRLRKSRYRRHWACSAWGC